MAARERDGSEEPSQTSVPILECRKVSKRFDGVVANDNIDFQLTPGEVHALLGQNGAGKTTLMNVFYGLLQPDEGEILVRGKRVLLDHPSDAITHGIGMVHQHMMLIPQLSVTENVVLGREIKRYKFFLDMTAAKREVTALSQANGLDVDPAAKVGRLAVGLQQRVEIIKLLYRHADILILDEPTALLTPQEGEELFRIIRSLADQGKSVIFITHKLKEVFEVADRITVLRDGRKVVTATAVSFDERELAELMVGHEIKRASSGGQRPKGRILLETEDIVVRGEGGRVLLDHVSFNLAAGEILGVAGIEGNGQNELVEVIAGLRRAAEGAVVFDGKRIQNLAPREIRRLGVGITPDDRQRLGLILPFKVSENLVLNRYEQAPLASGGRLNWRAITAVAKQVVSMFDIRVPSVLASVSTLSGGNQQKVVVGRELSVRQGLLVASQPTRGVDVASYEFIHGKLLEATEDGTAVLLLSSDLDELLSITDRIIVLLRGRLVGNVETAGVTREELGQLMLGVLERTKETPVAEGRR